jgi:signal transduction histidine kinase
VAALVGALDLKRVKVRRPEEPVIVHIDRAKFEQVLIHLVDNALKFSTGEVSVEVVVRTGEVEVTVADHGPGIFSGDIPQLFERFRQLDGTSTRLHGGTGIGLYLCRRLVEAQGGRIRCESRMGVGSRFIFAVPARQPEAAALTSGW